MLTFPWLSLSNEAFSRAGPVPWKVLTTQFLASDRHLSGNTWRPLQSGFVQFPLEEVIGDRRTMLKPAELTKIGNPMFTAT